MHGNLQYFSRDLPLFGWREASAPQGSSSLSLAQADKKKISLQVMQKDVHHYIRVSVFVTV